MRRSLWFVILVIVPNSFQNSTAPNNLSEETSATDIEGDEMQTRILNRKPNRYPSKINKEYQSLYRPPCFDVACPVDDSYPIDFVSSMVANNLALIEQLHSMLYRYPAEKLILLENATDSYRVKGNFACESDVVWLKLGWAHDVTGRNLLVVNTPRYPQIHRLETCRYAGKHCEFLPPCYRSRCQQRYTHKHMIVIDPAQLSGGPFVDLLPLPSSCSCFVENFVYF
ncbi:uncharacterized protein LOC124316532 isoform X1 [Daphnia pulicaria]|uniref:uncharacterized protein LOC124316532 isoform X1 n=1 Tax=Daphnia pulicaria TaxID=35523 RepID=UPI001EEA47C6|nr:uncharacterized protein LOC124316532 isoform X1 [Daphnia pulicaria]